MKRTAQGLGLLLLMAFTMVGCGETPPPADGSNLPPEVKAGEDELKAKMERPRGPAGKATGKAGR